MSVGVDVTCLFHEAGNIYMCGGIKLRRWIGFAILGFKFKS